ncbi:hypothetical protein ACL90Y_10545 [Micrococcus luteus]
MTNQHHGSDSGAKEKAQAVAGQTRHEAGQVGETARDAAGDLAGTAREEIGNVRDEAMQQVSSLADTAAAQVKEQAGTQKDRAAQQARTVTDDLQRVARGEQAESALVSGALSTVAQQAERLTHRLETAAPAELLDDVRSFAARRPGTFLAIALGAGLVAGRLTRGVRDAGQGADRGARQHLPSEHREHMQQRTLNPPAHAADDPTAPGGDVAPHHLQSQAPAYGGTPAQSPGATPGRPGDVAGASQTGGQRPNGPQGGGPVPGRRAQGVPVQGGQNAQGGRQAPGQDTAGPAGDVAPHHLQGQAPAYGGAAGQGNPNAQAHITETPAEKPFDQEKPEGRA